MRKPTTNPKIDGEPMSFVRLVSKVAGFYYDAQKAGRFTDSRGVPYERLPNGQNVRIRKSEG